MNYRNKKKKKIGLKSGSKIQGTVSSKVKT